MKKILLLLFTISLLSTTACNSDDDAGPTDPIDQLPDATQTGENTFGCLINGESFEVSNTNDLVAIFQQGQLQFGANSEQNGEENSFNFNIIDPLDENITYNLGNNSYNVGYSIILDNSFCIYEFDDTLEGNVTFSKIDRTNYIISGTFSFSTVKENCEDIIITNGRFDLQYIP